MTEEELEKAFGHAEKILGLFEKAVNNGDADARQVCKSLSFAILKMSHYLPKDLPERKKIQKAYEKMCNETGIRFVVF